MTPTPLPLRILADAVPGAILSGDGAASVHRVTADSRDVGPGDLFVAVRGVHADGHRFVGDALARGAAAVVIEAGTLAPAEGSWLAVPDTGVALALLAHQLWGAPSERLGLLGVTGTNGKTTTTYVLEAILAAAGHSPVVLGTVSFRHGAWEVPATHTTPDGVALARILAEREAAGATHAVLEVSSHALAQGRADGLRFDVGIFTNLTRDHLEFHPDMEAYFAAKARLFRELLPERGKGPRARVIWGEDPFGQRLLAERSPLPSLSFGAGPGFDVRPVRAELDLAGIRADVATPAGTVSLRSALVGAHNLLNILGAVGAAVAVGIPLDAIARGIEALRAAPGRLEAVGERPRVFVDYAHSPDALAHVGAELKRLSPGRLVTVFGCAGDRDPGKRPLMAQAAHAHADAVVVTSDNPRTEDPHAILTAVVAGLPASATRVPEPRQVCAGPRGAFAVEGDRRRAILETIAGASDSDTVLIAGKGHETYQIVGREKRDFDDRVVAREALAARHAGGEG